MGKWFRFLVLCFAIALCGCGRTEKEIQKKIEAFPEGSSYIVEYAIYEGDWEGDTFMAEKYQTSLDFLSDFCLKLEKEKVEELLSTLKLEEGSISEKMKTEGENSEESYGWAFCLHEDGKKEPICMLMENGKLYYYGCLYTGEQEEFKEAVRKLIHEKSEEGNIYAQAEEALEAIYSPEEKRVPEQPMDIEAEEVSFPFALEEGSQYTMTCVRVPVPTWSRGYFMVEDGASGMVARPMVGTLKYDKGEMMELLLALDMDSKNFPQRMEVEEEFYESGYSISMSSELDETWCFEISRLNEDGFENENLLVVSGKGEIYVRGYRYDGDREPFYEALKNMIAKHEKDISLWQYRLWQEKVEGYSKE